MQRPLRSLPMVVAAALVATALSVPPAAAGDPAWLGVLLGRSAAGPGEAGDRPGVIVTRVFADSPAAAAGLRARDRIVAVDGTPVESSRDLIARVRALESGAWVPLSIERGDDELEIRVRLAARPSNPRGGSLRQGWIGVEAIDLPESLREHFGAPADAGAMISAVEAASPAEAAGFELGDVVFEIDGEPLRGAEQLGRRVGGAGVGNELEFRLMRDGVEVVLESVVEQLPERDGR